MLSPIASKVPFYQLTSSVIAISDSVGNTHLINTVSQAETRTCPTNSEYVNAMCFSPTGAHLYTASDDQRVCSFEYPSLKFEHFIDRAQMPVKHIALNKDGSLMAIASLEPGIKMINIKKEPSLFSTLTGHEGGTLCVAFDPTDKLLASAGRDGAIRVWNVSNGQEVVCLPDMVAKEVLKGFSDKLSMPYRVEWTFDGRYLIVPHKKCIALLDRKNWKIFKEIKEENMGIVYMVTSSPSYSNFVCCDINKKCYFFDIESNITSKRNSYPMKHVITTLQWSPNSDACLVGDSRGNFKVFDLNKKIPIFDAIEESESMTQEERGPKKPVFQFDESVNGSLSSFPVSQDAFSQPASQTSLSQKSTKTPSQEKKKVETVKTKQAPPRFDEDDIMDDENVSDTELVDTSMLEQSFPTFSVQKSFQPGASDLIDKKRFLAYNEVGMIICTEDTNSNSVEIEFHDVITYKHERFNDPALSSMAGLSQHGAIFACKKKGKNASSFFYKSFNSWSTDTQWKIVMEEEEEIECVALCDHFVIVSTHTRDNQYFVRIYTTGGLQQFSP
jgi:chromosome transmission fidelity protein 4